MFESMGGRRLRYFRDWGMEFSMADLRPPSLPMPTRASKANIYAYGEHVAEKLGLRGGSPLEPIISELGGEVEYSAPRYYGQLPESIRVEGDKRFTIYVPTTTSIERDRFTIAHELGHFFLHWPLVKGASADAVMVATRWVDENDQDQKRCEWEANWFAAAFLMPSAEFQRTCAEKGNCLALVARYFGVSSQPAQIRATGLGIELV